MERVHMDRIHSYLESRRKELFSGKLIRWDDNHKGCHWHRYFWMDIQTGNIFELDSHYHECFPHKRPQFSGLTAYSVRAGHVMRNWTYYMPF